MSGKSKAKCPFSSAAPNFRYAMGFTLIEVLIAMTLLGIMVVLLFSSMRICAQSWEQGENKITDVNEVAVVYNFFQRHLALAIPVWNDFLTQDEAKAADQPEIGGEVEKGNKLFSFQGKKQSLQFVSVFPASAGRSGMQLFSIQPQQQDGEQVINVTLTPFFPAAEGEEWRPEEVVLLRHVSDFTLAYFGAVEGESESSWQDEWLKKDVQPQLVKISISTTNGVFWPEMIIALKATGGVSNATELGDNDENVTNFAESPE
ncbi:prepilin-type N-terminal cleavage/methylation domain-containing protein [Methylobacter sp.]|uniref:prepilin-type N-terminal cleavage/methylation domain-containing protein n=1 Tax=Methylobacter sp. TaxID=2051955 RepID=UPI001201B3FA|nr:prepilin-type N-terminal cleavage/methylation domain-containing protein [Methylobacter sp.]TAK62580.1 MAG: prepilin-type N-terminal cleavage/methylation domain-containing protein [Methylobacter sp.]